MTDRIPLDHLTSDALDALYEQLEAAEDTETQRQLAVAREAFASATTRAARAEAELAALRQVARGYCPHCGRGDAAPTVEDWEQQKQRADQAEAEITACRRQQWPKQLAHAEDAIERVRAECDAIDRDRARLDNESFGDGYADAAARIRLALDEPAPAATQTTDHHYLSTGCLHGDTVLPDGRTGHQYCQSDTGKAGAKTPAQCKFCQAPCTCPCHTEEQPDA